jgi:DNA-binding NarL/FixJ family response regulator
MQEISFGELVEKHVNKGKKAPLFPTHLFNRSTLPKLSNKERQEISIMIVDPDQSLRTVLRQMLTALGFAGISDASDNIAALQKLEQREFTHLIFDSKTNKMSSREFLTKVFEYDEDIVAIPTSFEPSVDDVFDLLVLGARGYLVKPSNEQSVEDSIVMATKAEPLSDAILHAKDRNEALVSLIMANVDKMAVIMRQSKQFETAKREFTRAKMALKRSVDIGVHFAKGGQEKLLEKIVEVALARGEGPASKLGRARSRRKTKKKKDSAVQ